MSTTELALAFPLSDNEDGGIKRKRNVSHLCVFQFFSFICLFVCLFVCLSLSECKFLSNRIGLKRARLMYFQKLTGGKLF